MERSSSDGREVLTAIDLFSGCGGLTTGLKLAGFSVVAAVESDVGACESYTTNHPDVPHVYCSDIRTISGERLLNDLGLKQGELDLLAGCPPCQGFSRMRTLNKAMAANDPRNELIGEYLRLIEELIPRALMFENVPGLVNDPRYKEILQRVQVLGYNVTDEIHDAASFGVPQRRKRLILLAARHEKPKMPAILGSTERRTVRQVIAELQVPGRSGDPVHDVTEARRPAVAELIRRIPHDGGSRSQLGPDAVLECHKRCDGFYDVYGRVRWDDVAPTITSGFVNPSKGRFLHPEQDRCLTPREAALLQTFPDNYQFPMARGKYAVAVMIGNAFPPRLAFHHAKAIADLLRYEKQVHVRRISQAATDN